MNSTVLPYFHFGMNRQCFAAAILTWLAYDDGRKRENSSAWTDRIIVASTSCRPTTCKTRPAGRVRPATRFCPAHEMFLNYNGNRPAACHRPPLHYTIEGLSCLPRHRLKTNVITTFIFFDNALLNAQWTVWILISTDIICRPFIPFVIRREIVVAQSGGFRGDWRIRICFSPIKSVLFGRACRVWDDCVEAEQDWWRASRIPGQISMSS